MISSNSKAINTAQFEIRSITKQLKFPDKLFFILEFIDLYAPHLKSTFSWKHHGRCFYISDKKSFEQNIMNLFFNSAKYDTFRRQLNIWGFTRITKIRSPDIGCYFHEKFLRSKFDLCNTMIRSRASELMKLPGNQPDFERMPIMPSTATLSIPHFTAMAMNLSSALMDLEHKDDKQTSYEHSNPPVQVFSDKKRKREILNDCQTHDAKYGLYSSLDSPVSFHTTAPLREGAPITNTTTSSSMTITDLLRLPMTSSSYDTCIISNDNTPHIFSDQAGFPSLRKKAKRVSINSYEDMDTFNEVATSQMFFSQQQVDDFNSMNLIPCDTATTSPSTSIFHHDSKNQDDAEAQWKENLAASKDTPLLVSNASSSSATLTFYKKSSEILSKDLLLSCNSLLSISAPTDLTEMKDFFLHKSNMELFEDSLSF